MTDNAARPEGEPRLLDTFGRVATDLRVSLTDRCNLRCRYCLPPEGLDWLPNDMVLTDAEVIRLITIAVTQLGITEVRFTGGEPLLRPGLEHIIAATMKLRAPTSGMPGGAAPATSLTTNGLGLQHRVQALAKAGLRRINVSLDTLVSQRFAAITHRDRWHDVVAGVHAAREAGLSPIKINAVLVRGINDDEPGALLDWAIAHGYELRFIEQMPLDPHGDWDRATIVTAAEILTTLQDRFELVPEHDRGASPAESWLVVGSKDRTISGSPARVGIIGSVTRPFCDSCDRTRLTADGQLRTCLFSRRETDLRALLRTGVDDESIADVWRGAMWSKGAAHGINTASFTPPDRPMNAIGG